MAAWHAMVQRIWASEVSCVLVHWQSMMPGLGLRIQFRGCSGGWAAHASRCFEFPGFGLQRYHDSDSRSNEIADRPICLFRSIVQ